MAFPSVQGRDKQLKNDADVSQWTIPFPVGWDTNTAGDRVYAIVSVDQGGTSTDGIVSTATSGWTLLGQSPQNQVRGAIFYYDVPSTNAVIPDLVVDSTTAERFSSVAYWVRSATGSVAHLSANATGNSTNSDPPSVTNTTGASIDALAIATRHGDGNTVATVVPTGYSNWQSQASGQANTPSTDTAEKQVTLANSASENPGVWTSATEQWVCYTLLVYESTGGSGTSGYIKVWDGSGWVLKPVKVWNGSGWVIKPVKFWDGAAWTAA